MFDGGTAVPVACYETYEDASKALDTYRLHNSTEIQSWIVSANLYFKRNINEENNKEN